MMENIRLIAYIDYVDVEDDFREVLKAAFSRGVKCRAIAPNLALKLVQTHLSNNLCQHCSGFL